MNLFRRTYLQGMHDCLVDSNVMRPFPDDDTGAAIFDKIAEEFGFPVRLERNLNAEETRRVATRMKTASEQLTARGVMPSAARVARVKTASLYDIKHRASVVASHYMEKAAAEGSLTDVGENTPQSAAKTDQLARVDQDNRPEGTYRGPRGETSLATPGIVGREVAAPDAPTSKTADLNSLIARLQSGGSRALGHVRDVAQHHRMPAPIARAGTAAVDAAQGALMHSPRAALGGAALGGAAALGGGAAGVHHMMGGSGGAGPTPEELARLAMQEGGGEGGMEVQASEDLSRSVTFMNALYNQFPGVEFSPEAKVATVGLASAGNPGIAAMHALLGNVKTAESAEEELALVLQTLTEQGTPPSPELVHALEEALGAQDAGGGMPPGAEGGMPPGMPPAEPPAGEGAPAEQVEPEGKEAGLRDIARTGANAVRAGAQAMRVPARELFGNARAAHAAGESALRNKNVGALAAKGVAGAAAVGGVAAGANAANNYRKTRKEPKTEEEKQAAAMLDEIAKAAGEGSLTDSEKNTPESAAKTDQIAAVDQKNRPDGTYENKGAGKTELKTESGEVGDEKKAEELYNENIRLVTNTWGGKLPAAMPFAQKRAHIEKIASLPPSARGQYVSSIPSE